MDKSVPKLFVLMTLMGMFATVGLLPVFADGGDQTVPLSPTGLNATEVSNTQLYFTWNAPVNATQSGITGYQIQQNGTVIVNDTQSAQTSLNYTGLIPDGTVEYQVAAWNSIGLGLPSDPILGTGDNLVDSAPVNDTSSLPPDPSANSTQTTYDDTPSTTNQTSLPITDPTTLPTTDPIVTLPSTDPTSTLPSVTSMQSGSHHYDPHRFYSENQTMSYIARLKLDQAMSHIHNDVLPNVQEHRALGTYHYSNSTITTPHVDHKPIQSVVHKSVNYGHLSQGVQRQVYVPHKTQSLQPPAFKQDTSKMNASHSNGFHYSSSNIVRTSSTQHTSSHMPTIGSLPGTDHRTPFYKSHLGNGT
ncbi:MAG: fibronectin type III domain-containing protein [Nitrosotalea sp.]